MKSGILLEVKIDPKYLLSRQVKKLTDRYLRITHNLSMDFPDPEEYPPQKFHQKIPCDIYLKTISCKNIKPVKAIKEVFEEYA